MIEFLHSEERVKYSHVLLDGVKVGFIKYGEGLWNLFILNREHFTDKYYKTLDLAQEAALELLGAAEKDEFAGLTEIAIEEPS